MIKKKMQSRKKHVPQRTCVACRTKHAKRELVRIVSSTNGTVIIDETGKHNGRGAYLCRTQACWKRALDTGILSQALRVTLTSEDDAMLRTYADALLELHHEVTGEV